VLEGFRLSTVGEGVAGAGLTVVSGGEKDTIGCGCTVVVVRCWMLDDGLTPTFLFLSLTIVEPSLTIVDHIVDHR
jgi:hypothetical protein